MCFKGALTAFTLVARASLLTRKMLYRLSVLGALPNDILLEILSQCNVDVLLTLELVRLINSPFCRRLMYPFIPDMQRPALRREQSNNMALPVRRTRYCARSALCASRAS